MPTFKSNENLVKHLIDAGVLKSKHVIEAFLTIDRKDFAPEEFKDEAYADTALPIGFGQTISQPYTVAFMLELLQAKEGDKILDIGSGSAWTVALLAYIVTEKGSVLGLEIIDELVSFGQENLAKYRFPHVQIQKADPKILGAPDKAPFDKILISAAAQNAPLELLNQLKQNGCMLAPVKNSLILFEKTPEKISSYEFPGFSFVPLLKSG